MAKARSEENQAGLDLPASAMSMPAPTLPGMAPPQSGMSAAKPATLMVPRCTFEVEKCKGGMKVTCSCDDKVAFGMLATLCLMLQGGTAGFYGLLNGMTLYYFQVLGSGKYEQGDGWVCFTFTSTEPGGIRMLQDTCDHLLSLLRSGLTCWLTMNNTAVCAGQMGQPVSSPEERKAAPPPVEADPFSADESLDEEPDQVVTYIRPGAYLRSVWAIIRGAFLHPFSTTLVDLSSGESVQV
jgi:hypothetical protein